MQHPRYVFEARRIVECEIARRLGGRLSSAQHAELSQLAQAEAEADAENCPVIRANQVFFTGRSEGGLRVVCF